MEKYKSLISSGLFTVFFTSQAIGYMHGHSFFGKVDADSTIAFGIYHLGHIFQPHNDVAWPLSPLLCGILLLMIPFIEKDWKKDIIQKENFIGIFTALLIPLTITIIEVSIIGPEYAAKLTSELLGWMKYPIFLSLIYFVLYVIVVLICWKYRRTISKMLSKLQMYLPKSFLLLITIIWLLYGCYIGSRFDGALDNINLVQENSFLKLFF